MKNQPIIYIIGDGRSGSTILEEYIAQNLGGIKIGEARRFWFRYYEAETLCECGDPINKCPFWNNVENELTIEHQHQNVHHHINKEMRFFKKNLLSNIVQNSEEIIHIQKQFYRGIRENTSSDLIIDSSKIHSWGMNLDSWDNNVIFIHLVRDISDVANSWKKNIILPEYIDKEVKMPKRSTLEHLKKWFRINLSILIYFKNKPNYIYLDYRDFCENPEILLNQLKNHSIMDGLNFPTLYQTHGIGGNPVRNNTSEKLHISYKTSNKNLNSLEKMIYKGSRYIYNMFKRHYVQ